MMICNILILSMLQGVHTLIFQAAEGLAHRFGISRSELYAEAISGYMKSCKNQNVTNPIMKYIGGGI